MNTSEKAKVLRTEMIELRKQIIQFMKVHNNPHDTCKHDEMAKKLQLIEQILGGGKVDTPNTGTNDGTTEQPSTDGTSGNLSTLKEAVEQARASAREALNTVSDLKAKQVTIDEAEKAKVKAYVAKADEFLQAYESADDAQKQAFDSANSGYVAEIKQSRDWNANDFLPRTEGGSSDNSDSSEQPSTPPQQGSQPTLPENPSIGSTVGVNAKNHPPNVKIVQMLLNKKGAKLEVDGKIGNNTIGAIERFQASVFDGDFDGVIGPNDKTWKKLVGTGGSAAGSGRPKPKPGAAGGSLSDPSWLKIAKGELGVKEIVGRRHNPRVIEYHSTTGGWKNDEVPWCASFVTWVMQKAGVSEGFKSALAQAWMRYGKPVKGPAYGAIGILKGSGHIGFVVGKQGNYIVLLGGNQGNMVKLSKYSLSRFMGFRFPSNYNPPASAFTFGQMKGKFSGSDSTH